MLKAMDAFDDHHKLAPNAALCVLLRPQSETASLEGIVLRIAGSGSSIPVAIAADGTFSRPREQAAADDNAELVLNRKKGLFRWRPAIHSPNVPDNTRRLGDLRLECRVLWAVEQDDAPFLLRSALRLAGPCTSSKLKLRFEAPTGASSVTVSYRERAISLALMAPGHLFSPPLYDTSWPDDTLLKFEFGDETSKPPSKGRGSVLTTG